MRKPSLLGFDKKAVPGIMDYYEATMADSNIFSGIEGRRAVFNAAARRMGNHKVVYEDDFESDGYTCVIGGKKISFAEKQEDLVGKKFHIDQVERDNYLLSMGLEQVLAFISEWYMHDDLISLFAKRDMAPETIRYLQKNRKLDITVEAIPEGIPIFANEPYLSAEGPFEQIQFPESLLLGTWGYQTAVATSASYLLNILDEFGRKDILTLEGGSRRVYPACSIPATRAIIAAGFSGTSNLAIAEYCPELLYIVGGSSGHSEVLHVGNDEAAFELQIRSYYRIRDGDSEDVIRYKIREVSKKGKSPTTLIDTFETTEGLNAAIRVMKKYGIQCQIRQDSDIRTGRIQNIRRTLDSGELPRAYIMISDDLKNWRIYCLLKEDANFNSILMGTYAVNPYRLPGAVYKIAMDQPSNEKPDMEYRCKLSLSNPKKGTLPGRLDVYRIIGKDGKADRDIILMRGVDSIDSFMQKTDQDSLKLNRTVMEHGEITYELPDMLKIIENTKYHLGLFRPEYKRFIGAAEYPVVVSPTIEKVRSDFFERFKTGRL